ncbi:bola-like protein [Aureobasidium namibiae CBS 147.97]|uniref:Bola-like protein n=1 Tax=Aureobasidium namibiae CBS 147.97 TaxID=1043004 RepID=A0A074X8E8_9PEZI
MAPSRAVFRSASTAFAALRTSSSRTLASTAPSRARQLHYLSLSARPLLTSNALPISPFRRHNSTDAATAETPSAVEAPDYLDEKELHIFQKLAQELQPTKLEVQDVSGGCGSMYALDIVSAKFKGLSVIKQHRLVNAVLKDEIKGWHGVQLKTKAP